MIASCNWCGEEFKTYPWRIKNGNKFCSPECYQKWRSENLVPTTECVFCGTEFRVRAYQLKVGKGKFCSRECMGKWRSENLIGERNPNWCNDKLQVCCSHHSVTNANRNYWKTKLNNIIQVRYGNT